MKGCSLSFSGVAEPAAKRELGNKSSDLVSSLPFLSDLPFPNLDGKGTQGCNHMGQPPEADSGVEKSRE